MELIKKHYKKIISYGLILLGLIAFALVLIIRPSRLTLNEIVSYNQKPQLTSIDFPYNQQIVIPDNQLSFLELRFGDDSINQHQYTIVASHESKELFKHTYTDEASNIIRIPIDNSEGDLNNNDVIDINIDCQKECDDVKFELYSTDNQESLKILYGAYKKDLGLLWYGLFPIAVGLTLLPLSKKEKK